GDDGAVGDPPAAGEDVLGDGELEARVVVEGVDLLDEALAEGLAADDRGAVELEQGAGEDLGAGRGAIVDEGGDRAGRLASAVGGVDLGVEVVDGGAVPADGAQQQAVVDEQVGGARGLAHRAAGVAAQVEDQAAGEGALAAEVVERGGDV